LFVGELFLKAKEMVREGGYKFKKGYSRSKGSSNESSSSDEGVKRAKINKEEREKAMEDLKLLLKSLEDQLRVKQMRITKAKAINDFKVAINDFKVADQLMDKVRNLLREKTDCDKQLLALEKKSSKSEWYRKRAHLKSTAHEFKDGSSLSEPEGSQNKIARFFKGNGNVASTSTSTATTDDVARQEKADKPVDRVISIDHSPQSDDTLIVSDSSELELSF
jgi:hypothetical protein